MQSIASKPINACNDEKLNKVFHFILYLPDKWKIINARSSSKEKIPSFIMTRYSKVVEQLFVLFSDNDTFFSNLDSILNSIPESTTFNSNQNDLEDKNIKSCKEFMQNLLYLSNYQSIYNLLTKFVLLTSSTSIHFFEKIEFIEILLNFLFTKANFTNKDIFDHTIRLIDYLVSNTKLDSSLITPLFNKYNKLNLISISSFNNNNYPNNISFILDLSLYNDSKYGINFVLSVYSKLYQSKNNLLNYINKIETIQKLYRYLKQKLNKKQFDAAADSSILLLSSIMNDIFSKENFILDIFKSDLIVENLKKTIKSSENEFKNDEEKNDFILFALKELQSLDNYKKNDIDHLSFEKEQNKCYNELTLHNDKNGLDFFGIPSPIYKDRNPHNNKNDDSKSIFNNLSIYDRNCFSLGAIQEENEIYFNSSQRVCNSYHQFEVTTTNQLSDNDNFGSFKGGYTSQKDNFTDLRAIDEDEEENELCNIELDKINENNDDDESADDESNSSEILDEDESESPSKSTSPKSKQEDIKEKAKTKNKQDEDTNAKDKDKQNKISENPKNKSNDDEDISKDESFNFDDTNGNKTLSCDDCTEKKPSRRRVSHTSLTSKDIEELINYSSSNEAPSRKKQPLLIPAIPNRPNQPRSPSRLRTFASLNNINACKTPPRSFANAFSSNRLTVENNNISNNTNININNNNSSNSFSNSNSNTNTNNSGSGIVSNFRKASISSSSSASSIFTGSKNSFTVTSCLGHSSNMNTSSNRRQANIPKRNSYSFMSPLKSLIEGSQSDINSGDDLKTNNSPFLPQTTQYTEDIFPTTIIETVAPEYAQEINIRPSNNKSSNEQLELDPEEEESNENNSKNLVNKNNEYPLTIPQKSVTNTIEEAVVVAPTKFPSFTSDDVDASETDDTMDVSATPRASFRRHPSKKRSSGSHVPPFGRKRSRKLRTSLPPSSLKISAQSDNNEPLSLIDLATSSEALNLDNFRFEMDRDFNVRISSNSGPLAKVVKPEFSSPFRRSLDNIAKSGSLVNFGLGGGGGAESADAIGGNEAGERPAEVEARVSMTEIPGLRTIGEGEGGGKQAFSPLETITEEADEEAKPASQLGAINEDEDENQQAFSPLGTITEEADEGPQPASQLETINEDEDENQQAFSPLGTITEEADEGPQPLSPLRAIMEEADEGQQSFSPLGAIAEEADEDSPLSPLEAIYEDEEEQPNLVQLETINEEDEEQQPFAQLGTVTEELDANERPISMLESGTRRRMHPPSKHLGQFDAWSDDFEQERVPIQKDSNAIYSSSSSFTKSEQQESPSPSEVQQKESDLFVSIGVLLANSLFDENDDEDFQSAICMYLNSLDKCTGMFDQVMMKSNLVVQILKASKEADVNQISVKNAFSKENIPMISKIVNNNHECIPSELKGEWNEYMKRIFEKEEDLQTNN